MRQPAHPGQEDGGACTYAITGRKQFVHTGVGEADHLLFMARTEEGQKGRHGIGRRRQKPRGRTLTSRAEEPGATSPTLGVVSRRPRPGWTGGSAGEEGGASSIADAAIDAGRLVDRSLRRRDRPRRMCDEAAAVGLFRAAGGGEGEQGIEFHARRQATRIAARTWVLYQQAASLKAGSAVTPSRPRWASSSAPTRR